MRVDLPANVVSFGGFEVDLDSGELRRAGVRLPLGEQPTRLLLALLRRPGALVIELPWFGLDHADRPMLVRDLSTHDIYALDLADDDK